MAKWGWGKGAKECGPVDHVDEYPVRVFDGSGEIIDWIDFIDEEKGVYRVIVREGGDKPKPGGWAPAGSDMYSPVKVVNGEVVTEMKKAEGKIRVFTSGEWPP